MSTLETIALIAFCASVFVFAVLALYVPIAAWIRHREEEREYAAGVRENAVFRSGRGRYRV